MSKTLSLALILILAVSSIIMVKPTFAQSIPKPSVPQFTVNLADHGYDVPPSVTSTTDPYNGKTTTTTFPGYHYQNITVDVTIENQPFPATIDGNTSNLYYNLRTKPQFGENWANNTLKIPRLELLLFSQAHKILCFLFQRTSM